MMLIVDILEVGLSLSITSNTSLSLFLCSLPLHSDSGRWYFRFQFFSTWLH